MRRPFFGLAAVVAIGLLASGRQAKAQGIGVGSDPFSFYYGYYLPHQAAQAMRPSPLDSINQMTAQRQYTAQTDRAALYDPISPYGEEEDPGKPYSRSKGGDRVARVQEYGKGGATQGAGPSTYYNRTARYHPTLRVGRGPNRNLAAVRSRAGGMGGGGMPQMPNLGMGGMGGIR